MEKQKTIAREVTLKGLGLHTANPVTLALKPAEPDAGINFIRIDLPQRPKIKASIDYLLDSVHAPRRTSLGKDYVQIHTVEHLMSALAGLGIDNLYVELNNNELPALDGSSLEFLRAIKDAGIVEQEKEQQYFRLKEPIFVQDRDASIIALPSQEFTVSYTLSYNHPLIGTEFLEININPQTYEKEIACARTFCLEDEAKDLLLRGLGQGANYENTLVVGRKGIIKNKLRFPDEFVRHKIADLVGDLYLVGIPLRAHIVALRSGHLTNLKLAQKINEQRKRYALGGIGIDYHPKEGEILDREGIMKILPHRDPFLFVDKIIHLEKGKRATGVKKLTPDDYFFKGHFPNRPVMPGVLILEAMAQVGGVMMLSPEENRGKLAYFLAADKVKFRKTVVPGDELLLQVEAGKIKSKTGQVHARALVNGKVVAEADFMFALVEG
ncbi:MAG: UDP-3-O-acyl-N-acetylglucosamine deacetylase [Candidatus Omnitrophica bacterium]|nr:UDP-3-O-acyl-N-acetylglucosamine deacetylase [Candidatus Omnitrophota bacterium]